MPDPSEGPIYTTGSRYRARAEAVQRRHRAETLKVGHGKYGHFLDEEAAKDGANFVTAVAHEAARKRMADGKGVAQRTFDNMLSSQAMCFNIFGPMGVDEQSREIAAKVLTKHVPQLARVEKIDIEYTPPSDIFGDQSGLSGVDCDVMMEFLTEDGSEGRLAIETKFVEPDFSRCGFRKDARCPQGLELDQECSNCLYASKKGYLYWQRCRESRSLKWDSVAGHACPFGTDLWQLWVNHTLAHAVAGGRRAVFAVCAPRGNSQLDAKARLDDYGRYVADPDTLAFIPVEDLISDLEDAVPKEASWREWCDGLTGRYVIK